MGLITFKQKMTKKLIPNRIGQAIKNQSGLSMLEVAIGLLILAVALVAFLSSAGSVSYFNQRAEQENKATQLASNKMEEIKRISTNEATGSDYGFSYVTSQTGLLASMTRNSAYKYSSSETEDIYTVTSTLEVYDTSTGAVANGDVSFDTPDQIRVIQSTVEVTWTDMKGQSKSVQLATLLHRRQFI